MLTYHRVKVSNLEAIIIIMTIIIILVIPISPPTEGLGLTLGSVFACQLFKRGDRVGYTQSTLLPQQLLGRAVA